MSNQKYVVLTHTNTLGGTGVRITDIQVEGDDVTLTAEHNGQLKLSLKKCVGFIMATSMGDAVVLTYLQPPVQPMAMGGNYGVPGGIHRGGLMGFDVESVVEGQVSALFQHELTTRLIEPLRQAACELTDSRPQAGYRSAKTTPTDNVTFLFEKSNSWGANERIVRIDINYPVTHIHTENQVHDVQLTRLSIRPGHSPSTIAFFELTAPCFDHRHVDMVSNALNHYNPSVGADYVRYMNIAKGDTRVDTDGRLYLRDTAGELGVITDIVFDDGLFTFSVSAGKQVQVPAAHLGLVSPAVQSLPLSTFGILSDPITDAHEVTMVYNALRQAFPKVAAEYLQFTDPNRKQH